VKTLNIIISNLSQTPIYEQIKQQIKETILSGEIKGEEQLPSIRIMAKELKVGIVTIKRAYEELEREGLVVNLQGRGCFAQNLDIEKIKEINLKILKDQLIDIKNFADVSKISGEEVMDIITQIYGGNN